MTENEKIGKRFGAYLRRERAWAGLTQKQLGAAVSMHQAQISRLERGEGCPRLHSAVRLMTVLGADPREMLEAID